MSTIPSVDRLSYLATDSTCDSTRGVVESLGRQVGGYLHAREGCKRKFPQLHCHWNALTSLIFAEWGLLSSLDNG